ncbi:YtxH domain-containing protein [Hymenobacter sp. NST-14]|uniref:YtxH domain-containing protein n=1 Tax=Hymenobacter piscis TaxID=2839984 RepID=UPI001C038C02|nr:YtxH domain-containing protein [Hymenobacter piscis]MBT9395193.1 YtxH domain-containing protein [Hymenobacter piscis]
MEDTKGKVILSLLAGATAGVVAGLLLAPETGDEARADLKRTASKLSADLSRLLKEGRARVEALKGANPADSEQHRTDRTAADELLNSLGQTDSDTLATVPELPPILGEMSSEALEQSAKPTAGNERV